MNQVGKKGPVLVILLTFAITFTALGIFLDAGGLSTTPDTVKLVKATAVQSSLSQCRSIADAASEPSEVSHQLSRAIEAVKGNESESAARLQARITASQRLTDETNHLVEEKGVSGKGVVDNAKHQQLNELKTRLAELKASE